MEWIDNELSHLLRNKHVSVNPNDIDFVFQEFLQEDDQEEPRTEDLCGVDNTYLNKKDMLLMKDCGFRWEAKAALLHERLKKREKEEEMEKNMRLKKSERKQKYNDKLLEMARVSNVMERASPAYTFNTVAEGNI